MTSRVNVDFTVSIRDRPAWLVPAQQKKGSSPLLTRLKDSSQKLLRFGTHGPVIWMHRDRHRGSAARKVRWLWQMADRISNRAPFLQRRHQAKAGNGLIAP